MDRHGSGWEVELDADDTQAYQVLAHDRIWNGYSIADLVPPYRAYTRVAVARSSRQELAACLFLQHPAFASIIPTGAPMGLAAILDNAELPPAAFVLVRAEHLHVLDQHYRFLSPPADMSRMRVDASTFQPPESDSRVERLGTTDLAALETLYAAYPGSSFNADQLATGPFYGVREDGALVAAGGVHVVAPRFGIGAVGNIFTLPRARGRGYGVAVTGAVVADLLGGVCRDIILNVARDNPAARRVYARLGFGEHCRYWEGRIERR